VRGRASARGGPPATARRAARGRNPLFARLASALPPPAPACLKARRTSASRILSPSVCAQKMQSYGIGRGIIRPPACCLCHRSMPTSTLSPLTVQRSPAAGAAVVASGASSTEGRGGVLRPPPGRRCWRRLLLLLLAGEPAPEVVAEGTSVPPMKRRPCRSSRRSGEALSRTRTSRASERHSDARSIWRCEGRRTPSADWLARKERKEARLGGNARSSRRPRGCRPRHRSGRRCRGRALRRRLLRSRALRPTSGPLLWPPRARGGRRPRPSRRGY
jgi:hypothetical protein